jgi:hypothetical protein
MNVKIQVDKGNHLSNYIMDNINMKLFIEMSKNENKRIKTFFHFP